MCGSGESVGAQVAHHVSSATNNIPSSALPTQQQQPPPQQQPPQQQQQPQPQHQQKHGELCEPHSSDPGDGLNFNIDEIQERSSEADKQQEVNISTSNLQYDTTDLVENTSVPCMLTCNTCHSAADQNQTKHEAKNGFVKSVINQTNSVSSNSFVYSIEKSGTTYFYTASPVNQPNFDWSPIIEPHKLEYYSNEYCVLQEPTTASILYGQCLYF